MDRPLSHYAWPLGGALLAGGGALLALKAFPALELELFARAAARLAGGLSGSAMERIDEGWALAIGGLPVVVTRACSGTDFFLLVVVLLGWHAGLRSGAAACDRRTTKILGLLLLSLVAAFVASTGINALRIVLVGQVHRWITPRLPGAYGDFLHLLTGVLVFLPALIALNLVFESHARRRSLSAPSA